MGKRLFIAADISEDARAMAAGLIASLRGEFPAKGLSWSKPENLHITIKFLGETDEPTQGKLAAALSSIVASCPTFRLHLGKPELLGKRVVSIAVDSDSTTVFDLEKRIDTECGKLGYESERRRFHPHLTLARIRKPGGARELGNRFIAMQIEPLGFDVREIVLYESELGAGGSVYKAVERFGLNG